MRNVPPGNPDHTCRHDASLFFVAWPWRLEILARSCSDLMAFGKLLNVTGLTHSAFAVYFEHLRHPVCGQRCFGCIGRAVTGFEVC